MGVSRATASGLLKGLETKELIVTSQSETDGRMKRVILTDAGKDKVDELSPKYYKLISKFNGKMDKKKSSKSIRLFCQI